MEAAMNAMATGYLQAVDEGVRTMQHDAGTLAGMALCGVALFLLVRFGWAWWQVSHTNVD